MITDGWSRPSLQDSSRSLDADLERHEKTGTGSPRGLDREWTPSSTWRQRGPQRVTEAEALPPSEYSPPQSVDPGRGTPDPGSERPAQWESGRATRCRGRQRLARSDQALEIPAACVPPGTMAATSEKRRLKDDGDW